MKSADYFVEGYFLLTHLLETIDPLKAVFLIDEFPYVGTIICSKGFNVSVNIEVLSFIVLLVLHMPNPFFLELQHSLFELPILPLLFRFSLFLPHIKSTSFLAKTNHLISFSPATRNIIIVASADDA